MPKAQDFLVVIPTVAEPNVLPGTMERVLRGSEGTRTTIVLSINPVSSDRAEHALKLIDALDVPDGIEVLRETAEGPLGFAKAVNVGLTKGMGACDPQTIVILNDDVAVTMGWLQGLRAAIDTQTVRVVGEPPGPDGHQADRPVEGYGRIGLAGPVSDNVAGQQSVGLTDQERYLISTDPDGYARQSRQLNQNNYMTADFLSGFCLALSRECYDDLVEHIPQKLPKWDKNNPEPSIPLDKAGELHFPEQAHLFDERFGIGGFEDNDLCVRAELQGWRAIIAGDIFVHHRGHQTLDRFFPGQNRGLANRLIYYKKWAPDIPEPKILTAIYRMKWTFGNDLHLTRGSVIRAAELCDNICILLTGNPLEITEAHDWGITNGSLQDEDATLLTECKKAEAPELAAAFKRWVECTIKKAGNEATVVIDIWLGDFNERDERNRSIEMAEELGTDWIFSIDHDEIPEDRIKRWHLDRLMSHPDPMKRAWDVGWLNHWNTPEQIRVDPPWSDGARYATSMRGFRIWKSSGRRILSGTENGLHCGNAPSHDPQALGVSAIRMRHFGYVRSRDRLYKMQRYRKLDPTPDPNLTGNFQGYGHLVHEENMVIAPYMRNDAITYSMLVHSGEELEDIARWLDQLYGIADHIVLVWTDEGDITDDFKELGEYFDVSWVHKPFDMNLGAARNAGVEACEEWLVNEVAKRHKCQPDQIRASTSSLGWFLTFDGDEWYSNWFEGMISLRRMAECTDAVSFMFKFANLRPEGSNEPPTISETMRLVKLDSGGRMRFHSRVHESFGESINELKKRGIHPQIRYAPHTVVHRGLAKDDADMETKLRRYTQMLVLELQDNPLNANAWMSLGLQYGNEGCDAEAVECLQRSIVCEPDGYYSYRELGLWHLRRARALYTRVAECLTGAHPYHNIAHGMLHWMNENVGDQPIVGLSRIGQREDGWLPELPDFPESIVEERLAEMDEENGIDSSSTEKEERPASL